MAFSMTKKLTGREALIALLQGKKVRDYDGDIFYITDENDIWVKDQKSGKTKIWPFEEMFDHDEWEIMPEPMVWEGELEGRDGGLVTFHNDHMPDWMQSKRVKVRIEEIL